ncbi:hypothetical protein ACQ7B2_01160, partial [Escherichia coli]
PDHSGAELQDVSATERRSARKIRRRALVEGVFPLSHPSSIAAMFVSADSGSLAFARSAAVQRAERNDGR